MRERAWHRVRALSVCLPPHRHASRQLSNEDSATTVRQRLMTGEVARTLGAALPVPRVSAVVHPLAGGWILAMIFFATFAPDRYAAAMQEDRAVEWWTMLLFAGAGVARLWFAVRYRRRRRRTSALRTIGGGCAGAGHRERRVTEAAGRRHGAQARLDGIDRRLPRHGPVGAVPGRPLPGGARDADARRRYIVDPWGTAYWIRTVTAVSGDRQVMIYSFGPNRRRDGDSRAPVAGRRDDIVAVGSP